MPYLSSIHVSVGSVGREYMKLTRPSAKKFFDRSASRGFTPSGAAASLVSEVIGTLITRYPLSEPSSSGLLVKSAFSRFRSSKVSTLRMSVPPWTSRPRSAFNAAGFIATSTPGASPGVVMSWSLMCTWKLETPLTVPAGARISAG